MMCEVPNFPLRFDAFAFGQQDVATPKSRLLSGLHNPQIYEKDFVKRKFKNHNIIVSYGG